MWCWCWYDDNINIDMNVGIYPGHMSPDHTLVTLVTMYTLCIFTLCHLCSAGVYQQVPHLSPLSPSRGHLSQQTPTCNNIVTKVYQSCWSKFLNVNVAQNSLSIKSSKLSVEQFICRELSSFLSLVSCYRCCCSCTNYKLEQYRLDFFNEPKNKNV